MKLLADLHVHSRASADGRSSIEALIEAAKARGLAAITVSDHDLCTPLPESPDVLLIPGVEITSANGHILGLFLERPIDFFRPREISRAGKKPLRPSTIAEVLPSSRTLSRL